MRTVVQLGITIGFCVGALSFGGITAQASDCSSLGKLFGGACSVVRAITPTVPPDLIPTVKYMPLGPSYTPETPYVVPVPPPPDHDPFTGRRIDSSGKEIITKYPSPAPGASAPIPPGSIKINPEIYRDIVTLRPEPSSPSATSPTTTSPTVGTYSFPPPAGHTFGSPRTGEASTPTTSSSPTIAVGAPIKGVRVDVVPIGRTKDLSDVRDSVLGLREPKF